jgi:L-seryl-tRNA(Ser) seleniumtransferase
MTLAALEATLRSYQRGRAVDEVPVWQMIAAPPDVLRARAQRWQVWLGDRGILAELWPGESAVGGGSLPGETLPTWLLALPAAQPDAHAARLRGVATPVICRIQQDHLLFDPRTVLPGQEDVLLQTLRTVMAEDETA